MQPFHDRPHACGVRQLSPLCIGGGVDTTAARVSGSVTVVLALRRSLSTKYDDPRLDIQKPSMDALASVHLNFLVGWSLAVIGPGNV